MIDKDFMDARQSNKYDKIAKENMEAIMPVILSAFFYNYVIKVLLLKLKI
jgi:hypothetical protein